MDDKSLFPLKIAHENRDWTLEIDVDQAVKCFTLKLNNRPFNDLPDESLNQGKHDLFVISRSIAKDMLSLFAFSLFP